MNGPRILVVDDEPSMRRSLRAFLTEHGFVAITAASGEAAVETVAAKRPDLVLLDRTMPGMGGIEACKQIRAYWSVPIIMLSAGNTEQETVEALGAGADDCMPKPFGLAELLARIGVALRHRAGVASGEDAVYRCADLTIDIARRLVTRGSKEVPLTVIEYDILRCLASQAGRPVAQAMLLREVWGPRHAAEVQRLRFGVFQLRKKLGEDPLHPRYIFTEPGFGYRFGPHPQ